MSTQRTRTNPRTRSVRGSLLKETNESEPFTLSTFGESEDELQEDGGVGKAEIPAVSHHDQSLSLPAPVKGRGLNSRATLQGRAEVVRKAGSYRTPVTTKPSEYQRVHDRHAHRGHGSQDTSLSRRMDQLPLMNQYTVRNEQTNLPHESTYNDIKDIGEKRFAQGNIPGDEFLSSDGFVDSHNQDSGGVAALRDDQHAIKADCSNDLPDLGQLLLPPHVASGTFLGTQRYIQDPLHWAKINLEANNPVDAETGCQVFTLDRLRYRTSEEAQAARTKSLYRYSTGIVDSTLPRSPGQCQLYATLILRAMLNMENLIDNKGMIQRWKKHMLKHDEVEQSAWEVLGYLINHHFQRGPSDPTAKPNPRYEGNFWGHLQDIISALKRAKTICCRNFRSHDALALFVDNPGENARRTITNQKTNAQKQTSQAAVNRLTRQVLDMGGELVEESQMISDSKPQPASRKTSRSNNETDDVDKRRAQKKRIKREKASKASDDTAGTDIQRIPVQNRLVISQHPFAGHPTLGPANTTDYRYSSHNIPGQTRVRPNYSSIYTEPLQRADDSNAGFTDETDNAYSTGYGSRGVYAASETYPQGLTNLDGLSYDDGHERTSSDGEPFSIIEPDRPTFVAEEYGSIFDELPPVAASSARPQSGGEDNVSHGGSSAFD